MTVRPWVYKNNSKPAPGATWGDWEEFFAETGPTTWGSTATIGTQNRGVAFEMNPGDQVLCWQTNRRAVIGLAVVVDTPEFTGDDGLIHREFVLEGVRRFPSPVPILDLRKADAVLRDVHAFKSGNIRTLYATTPAEAQVLLGACGSPVLSTNRIGRARRANKDSELAAVRHVTDHYVSEGWTVVSRQREKVGYDLHATRGRRELHLEVKGTVGAEPSFFLTANESRRAEEDRRWRLCLVRSALDPTRRRLDTWTGRELLTGASWAAASYRVTMEPES